MNFSKNTGAGLVAVVLFLSACSSHKGAVQTSGNQTEPTTKTVVVLLDKTASIKDQNGVFKSALRQIVSSLKPGDKFRLAEITGASSSDFDFVVKADIPTDPPYNPMTTNEAFYKDAVAKLSDQRKALVKNTLGQAYAELAKKPSAMTTDLFGAITTAGLYVKAQKHTRKILVLLSDMIEEDNHWRFQHVRWSDKLRATIMKHAEKLQLIPDLSGVDVYVVGARGPSLSVTQNIRFFWSEYFQKAHANMPSSHYAHTLLVWAD